MALVLVLGVGRVPLAATFVDLCVFAAPAYLLRWSAHLLLGQGRLGPLSSFRGELLTLGADVGVLGSSSGRSRLPGLEILIGLLGALAASVGVRVLAIWWGWESELPGPTVAVALALASIMIGMATGVIVDSHTSVQRRAHRRVRLGLVTCRVEEREGFLVDLSRGGVSVALPASADEPLTPGSITTLSFRVPSTGGRWRTVTSVVHVVRSSPDHEGGVRLGLEFDDLTAGPLEAVAEFLVSGCGSRFAWSGSLH